MKEPEELHAIPIELVDEFMSYVKKNDLLGAVQVTYDRGYEAGRAQGKVDATFTEGCK